MRMCVCLQMSRHVRRGGRLSILFKTKRQHRFAFQTHAHYFYLKVRGSLHAVNCTADADGEKQCAAVYFFILFFARCFTTAFTPIFPFLFFFFLLPIGQYTLFPPTEKAAGGNPQANEHLLLLSTEHYIHCPRKKRKLISFFFFPSSILCSHFFCCCLIIKKKKKIV